MKKIMFALCILTNAICVLNVNAQETLVISPTNKSFTSSGGTVNINIDLAYNRAIRGDEEVTKKGSENRILANIWTANESYDWLSVSPSGGSSFPGSVTITCSQNYGEARNGSVTINSTYFGSQSVSISQSAAPNNIIISPININSPYEGCTSTLTASGSWQTPAGVSATTGNSWIHPSPSGGASVTVVVDANNGAERTGYIYTYASNCSGSATTTITQSAAPNLLSLSPGSISPGYNGGSSTVNASGSWQTPTGVTASENQTWISTSVSGTTVSINVTANSGAARSGTVTVNASNVTGSQTVSVNQSAAPPNLVVNPTSLNLVNTSGSTTFNISNSGGGTLEWYVDDNMDWLSCSPENDYSNNATIIVSYLANSGSLRSGTITISDASSGTQKTIAVSQDPAPINLIVTPTSLTLGNTGSTTFFEILNTGGGMLEWTVSDNVDWLTCEPTGNISNQEVITVSYSSNTGPERFGTITIEDWSGITRTISVTQNEGQPILNISENSFNFGNTTGTVSFAISNSGGGTLEWHVMDNVDWLSCSPTNDISNVAIIIVNYSANDGDIRTGTITINDASSGSQKLISITQDAGPPIYHVDTPTFTVNASSGSNTFTLSNPGGGILEWETEVETPGYLTPWITDISPTSGQNDGNNITFLYTANTGQQRTGYIKIMNQMSGYEESRVTIIQESNEMTFATLPIIAPDNGEDRSVIIGGTKTQPANVSSTGVLKPDWLDNFSYDLNTHTMSFRIKPNNTSEPRTGIVRIYASNVLNGYGEFQVSQVNPPVCQIGPNMFNLEDNSGIDSFVISNTGGGILEWEIEIETPGHQPPWITNVTPRTGQTISGQSTTVIFSYTENTNSQRTGNLKIMDQMSGYERCNVTITQKTGLNNMTFTPNPLIIEAAGGDRSVIISGTKTVPTDVSSTGLLKPDWVTNPSFNNNALSFYVIPNTGIIKEDTITVFSSMVESGRGLLPIIQNPAPQPSAPDTLIANLHSSTEIRLTWTNVLYETHYLLDRSISESGPFTTINVTGNHFYGTGKELTYIDKDLLPGTRYYYQIRSVNNISESNRSSQINIWFQKPETPSGLQAEYLSPNQIKLVWNNVSYEDTFKIYRSNNPLGPFTTFLVCLEKDILTYTDIVPVGGEYYYKISAVNRVGESQLSSTSVTPVWIPSPSGIYALKKVGIGTEALTDIELGVCGKIAAQEVVITALTEEWPDFVFDEEFKPMSMFELENFVKENKHLPEIPGKDEVEKEGFNLGFVQSKLLKKIEELTLYVLDIKRKNEQVRERIKALEINNKLEKY